MVADEGEAAKHWARWRGPSGQGLVSGSGLSRYLVGRRRTCCGRRPVSGRAAIPRRSSGAIASSSPRRTTTGAGCRCVAYRRTDGASCGKPSHPRADRAEAAHYKNGHASATPATDGQRVYVSFGARGLVAFDMDGKLVWHRDLGPMEAYHGTAGSPLLYKDRVILYQDQFAGLVHRRVRHAHRARTCGGRTRDAQRRVGHADRRSRRRSRRDHRQRPAAGAGLQPGHRRRAVALRRHARTR